MIILWFRNIEAVKINVDHDQHTMIMPCRRKEVACEDFQATNLKAFPKILFETLGCGVFFFLLA